MPDKDSHGYSVQKSLSDIYAIENAISMFELDYNEIPNSYESLEGESFKKYIRRLPRDSWENEYIYKVINAKNRQYYIYSSGPNGIDNLGKYDDVTNIEKEYKCELFNDCLTVKDKINVVSSFCVLLSFLIIVLSGLYKGVSFYWCRKKA